METFGVAVMVGLLICVLWNVLTVKQMLKNHYEQTANDDDSEFEQQVYSAGKHVSPRD